MNEPAHLEPEIRLLRPDDVRSFAALVDLFDEVFELDNPTRPSDQHLRRVLGNVQFLALAALINGHVVGGLTAYVLEGYHCEAPQAYLYDLAVQHNLQRQGIGRKLVAAFLAHCTERGYAEAFVQADGEDLGPQSFYRAAGGRGAPAVQFSFPLNLPPRGT